MESLGCCRKYSWRLFIAVQFLSSTDAVGINPDTLAVLAEYGFAAPQNNLVPAELFSLEALQNPIQLSVTDKRWIHDWIWNTLCRRLYFRPCNNRPEQLTTSVPCCGYWFFHRWLAHDPPIFSLYFLNYESNKIFTYWNFLWYSPNQI